MADDQLLAFKLGRSGNLAPLRGLKGAWVKGIVAINVDAEANELYLLNPKISRITVYDRQADMLYRSSDSKLKPKREIYSKDNEISRARSLALCSTQKRIAFLNT